MQLLKGKIHRAHITHCDLDYEGSLEIDPEILAAADILPYEKILVVNATNGERLETYAIPGEPGTKIFRLNGAAAHRGRIGDIITIMCFASYEKAEAAEHLPTVLVMDAENNIAVRRKGRTVI